MEQTPNDAIVKQEYEQSPAAPRQRSRARIAGFIVAGVVLLGTGATGGALAATRLVDAQSSSMPAVGNAGGSDSAAGQGPGAGFGSFGGSASSSASGTAATSAQTVGVVTITTVLGYANGEAAGTGIVLTSNGEILTNNHVIAGSTSITVTDETTGRSYTASVVGTDATDDVAVLQLQNASGLQTATLASAAAATGDTVTAVGNAGGTGELTIASGTVAALNQTITTQAEGTAASETLQGLIQTDADVVAGDSGGPLLNTAGAVVGIDTAASSGTRQVESYAIPIVSAVSIAQRIEAGDASATITIGTAAFLGVEIDGSASVDGAAVAGTLDNTPAVSSGLAAGDVITAVDGASVGSNNALSIVLQSHRAGDTVTIHWTDAQGQTHAAQVTLIQGPAD